MPGRNTGSVVADRTRVFTSSTPEPMALTCSGRRGEDHINVLVAHEDIFQSQRCHDNEVCFQ